MCLKDPRYICKSDIHYCLILEGPRTVHSQKHWCVIHSLIKIWQGSKVYSSLEHPPVKHLMANSSPTLYSNPSLGQPGSFSSLSPLKRRTKSSYFMPSSFMCFPEFQEPADTHLGSFTLNSYQNVWPSQGRYLSTGLLVNNVSSVFLYV